jgi:isopentenyldiphosphate isomerase
MNQTEIIARMENGQFHSWIQRRDLDNTDYNYRCINIVIVNSQKHILVQERSEQKRIQPLHWDVSVAGHIPMEDYPDQDERHFDRARVISAQRELLEELGIETKISFLMETPPVEGIHNEFISFFIGRHNGPFVLQKSEVRQVRFIPIEHLSNLHPKTKQLQWMIDNDILQNIIQLKS